MFEETYWILYINVADLKYSQQWPPSKFSPIPTLMQEYKTIAKHS